MKAFIMCYYEGACDRHTVSDWADQSALVQHWRYDMPGCVYLLSEKSASELSKDFRRLCGTLPFIVSEVGGDLAGTMLPDTWMLLNDKHASRLSTGDTGAEAAKRLQPA